MWLVQPAHDRRKPAMSDATPFDDIRSLIQTMPSGDAAAGVAATEACGAAAGELGQLANWLATWSGKARPKVDKPVVAIFAGAHGVVGQGVSAESSADIRERMAAISDGSGLLPRLCAGANIGLKLLDLAVDLPTRDITLAAALDERDCAATIAFGMEAAAGGHDVLALGAIGAGGETAASALIAAAMATDFPGWRLEQAGHAHIAMRQSAAVEAALLLHAQHIADPLEALRRLGGREIAAICGAIIAARMERIPVVLDGMAAIAAAAVIQRVQPAGIAHCRLASAPVETALAEACRHIGLATDAGGLAGAAPGIAAALIVARLRAASIAASPPR